MTEKRDLHMTTVVDGNLTPHNATIHLADYDPDWPRRYAVEEARIRGALGERVKGVWHMGSTSVPGLAAKPLIDVTLAVADSADEASYVPALVAAGYYLRRREPEWHEHRVLKWPAPGEVNLHVYSEGCSEIERVLMFRDWLRANAEDRALYEATKRRLSAQVWEHVQDYADAKGEVVEAIVARATAARAAGRL
jgi:GrpB-like predicted nucleotidyltransferase (UPF0157 family)